EFASAVVFAAVQQPPFATFTESIGHLVDRGVMNAQHRRRLVGSASVQQIHNDQIAQLGSAVAALPQVPKQLLLDGTTYRWNNRGHGIPSLGACPPETLSLGIPIFVPRSVSATVTRAAESRTVI